MDSSVFVKSVLDEPESRAVHLELSRHQLTSSRLLVAESRRAVGRAGERHRLVTLALNLQGVSLIELSVEVVNLASQLGPATLRTLDAIHLASALIAPDVDVFVCLDHKLSEAAKAAGFQVVSPR